jgi:glutaconate CoA-transferase subunit B
VRALVTDLGRLEKRTPDGELELCAIPAGPESRADRVERARVACGWPLVVRDDVEEVPPPTAEEIRALRTWDPRAWFLRGEAGR